MAPGIPLIVGLGNPGAEYAETRHNAGFLFLDAVLEGSNERLRSEPRFQAAVCKIRVEDSEVRLLAPVTYMNNSGDAVVAFARYYQIPIEKILVVHDDLDLPPGVVRLKRGGGDGGHNGLSDVIAKCGTPDFMRLRIGIGHPGAANQVVSYVLKKPPATEQRLIHAAILSAKALVPDIVRGEFQRVMNVLHTSAK